MWLLRFVTCALTCPGIFVKLRDYQQEKVGSLGLVPCFSLPGDYDYQRFVYCLVWLITFAGVVGLIGTQPLRTA